IIPRPPTPTLFPYTTLFRSRATRHVLMDWAHRLLLVLRNGAWSLCHEPQPRIASASISTRQRGSSSPAITTVAEAGRALPNTSRSEEHTSELQSQSNLVCRL